MALLLPTSTSSVIIDFAGGGGGRILTRGGIRVHGESAAVARNLSGNPGIHAGAVHRKPCRRLWWIGLLFTFIFLHSFFEYNLLP